MTTILFKSCALCGHLPDPDNYADSFHPTGQGWRDDEISPGEILRHYIRRDDPRGVHGYTYEMNCLDHEGGCGMSVTGDSQEETIEKWNTRPEDTAEYIGGRTIVAWRYGALLRLATPEDDVSGLMNMGFAPLLEVPPSTTFALPEAPVVPNLPPPDDDHAADTQPSEAIDEMLKSG